MLGPRSASTRRAGPSRVRQRRKRLRRDFPFRDVFLDALSDYRTCPTYWYIPKARALNDENVKFCAQTLQLVFEDFLGATWNRETQDELLSRLIEKGLTHPYTSGGTIGDRTALTRIINALLATLGLLWAETDQEIIITDAGFAMIAALANDEPLRPVVEQQVVKLQYPHPLLSRDNRDGFGGLVPHMFLLQVLQDTEGHLTFEEQELFVNLATEQNDVPRTVRYIEHWRNLSPDEQAELREIFRTMPTVAEPEPGRRFRRIRQDAAYQRSFFCYPSWLEVDSAGRTIRILEPGRTAELTGSGLKVTGFDSREDWFSYLGDPERTPSWFDYLAFTVESAESSEQARAETERFADKLSEEESAEITRLEIEKAIESAYAENPQLLHMLEEGLQLMGRQVETPIGRIDLLCRGSDGKYVVVEIKAKSAEDSVFGQILRYIGWVHSNYDDGRGNVRGIILASQFSDKARYSRIGLLKSDAEEFLQFHRPPFAVDKV